MIVKAVSSLGMDLGSSFGIELLVLLSSVTRSLSFFNVCFSLLPLLEFSAASCEEGPSSSARPKCTIMTIFCQLFALQFRDALP